MVQDDAGRPAQAAIHLDQAQLFQLGEGFPFRRGRDFNRLRYEIHFRPERLVAKPDPAGTGLGVAYLDWSQQEFAIAAVLSGDGAMQTAYLCPAIPTSNSQSRPAPCRRMQRNNRTGLRASCSSNACSASATAWKPKVWRNGSDSPKLSPAICCARTTKPTASPGYGPMRMLIAPC